MEFRLLGPFEARLDGAEILPPTRRQERCLLAILVLGEGRVVPVARLAELLWDGSPPASPRATVHTYVGRLRRAWGPYGVRIETKGDGYRVDLDGHVVDVDEFVRLVERSDTESDPAAEIRLLDQAVALWRGPLLADLADGSVRARLGSRLDELRLSALEARAGSRLAVGDHRRVVAELAPLVEEYPTREQLVAALMTALYRSGRQGDALRLYTSTRQRLVDELGVEPGPELRALHGRVLRNDRALDQPEAPVFEVRFRGTVLPWSVGGHPALEFCNTYSGWHQDPPLPGAEWLRDYATLAAWTAYVDLADDVVVDRLLRDAQDRPSEAEQVLAEVRDLRAQIYRVLTQPDDQPSFRAVARHVEAAAKVSVFGRGADGLGRWSLSPSAAGLRLPVYAAARVAGDLLVDPRRLTVRRCLSDSCGWLFLDATGLRRWCSVVTCGGARTCFEGIA